MDIIKSTLASAPVEHCLIEKIKEFEFPPLKYGGMVEYVYHFEPAY